MLIDELPIPLFFRDDAIDDYVQIDKLTQFGIAAGRIYPCPGGFNLSCV